MVDALYARRPENDRTQATATQKSATPMQRTGDFTLLPLYTQAWGNQPPPQLRLHAPKPERLKADIKHLSGEQHQLSLNLAGPKPMLIRSSEPAPLEHYLDAIEKTVKTSGTITQQQAFANARSLQKLIVDYTDPDTGKGRAWKPEDGDQVQQWLADLTKELAVLPGERGAAVGSAVRPPSTAKYSSGIHISTVSDGKGGTVQSQDSGGVIAEVSTNPGALAGSEPQYTSKLLEAVNVLKGGNANYIAGHMLNHHLHGKATDAENLTPISGASNTQMEREFEKDAKEAVLRDNEVLHYEVKPDWATAAHNDAIGPESDLPKSLDVNIQKKTFGGVDVPAERSDPTKWLTTGPVIYKGSYALKLNDNYVKLRNELKTKASDLVTETDTYRTQATAFGALSAILQASVNKLHADAQAILADPQLMHKYKTHLTAIYQFEQDWKGLEANVLLSWPGRAKRKRK